MKKENSSDNVSKSTSSTTDTKSYVEQAKQAPRVPLVRRWKPGESGNPAGRPKGSKNRVTLIKTDVELTLREFSSKYVPEVLRVAIQKALEGDNDMIKLILGLHMSKPQHHDSEDSGKGTVQILVQNLTQPSEKPVKVTAIDVTPQPKVINHEQSESDASGDDGNPKKHPEEHSASYQAGPERPQ